MSHALISKSQIKQACANRCWAIATLVFRHCVFLCENQEDQAKVSNKGVRGVYGLGVWSLIECLEDKAGDISHPGGQRMGG